MKNQSMEEVLDEYKSAMGDELGASFFELHRELVELHVVWQQYRQLFGDNPETIDLLNRTSGFFFKIVQDELWDSTLLRISRLTDPPETLGKKNLVIRSLPALIEDPKLQAEVQELCEKALSSAAFAREHRNKRIAHQDHDYLSNRSLDPLSGISRASVEKMLTALGAVLNCVEKHFLSAPFMYEEFADEDGARVLIHKLKKLEQLQAATVSTFEQFI